MEESERDLKEQKIWPGGLPLRGMGHGSPYVKSRIGNTCMESHLQVILITQAHREFFCMHRTDPDHQTPMSPS